MIEKKVDRSLVVVASDIEDDDNREEFREFMIEELASKSRTESVYEFNFEKCGIEWNIIVSKLNKIINSRTDTVYLWDIRKPEGASNYELYRTKIGK